jgi:cytochrome c
MHALHNFQKISFLFALLALQIQYTQASSEDQQAFAIAKQNACLGCHAINKKIVGPSFESVAQKYQADSNAQAFLKNKIAKGGTGSWGVVPMPANTKLSDAELTLLVSWILRGAPIKN